MFLSCDLSEKGWNLFLSVFKVPVSLFAYSLPFFGLILALIRMWQSDVQFSLTKHSINMGLYFEHQNQFIKLIDDYIESQKNHLVSFSNTDDNFLNRINNGFKRKLYSNFFGNKFDSNQKIVSKQKKLLKELYNELIMLKNKEQNEEGMFHIAELIETIGFTNTVFPTSISEDLIFIIDLCDLIMEFSDDVISESAEVLEYRESLPG